MKSAAKKKSTTDRKCRDCPATCCHNLSIRVLRPKNKKELDELRWHLYYDTVKVYIASNRWHLLIEGRCIHLGRDNLCGIYKDRPWRCRKHNPPHCEKYGGYWDTLISTPYELDDYLRK